MKRSKLVREIVIVLTAKLILLTGLYIAFFSPPHRPASDADAVSARLLSNEPR